MEQTSKPETDLLGRRWYRIDVYKGDMIYDRLSITAMSDEAAELAVHQGTNRGPTGTGPIGTSHIGRLGFRSGAVFH